ncbi:hypothetical protein MANI_020035 [Metarhizium anisopliae]|nr:hypothetical protein MANI_020035 [Metarhizium anisopliae]
MSNPKHEQILEWLDAVIDGLETGANNVETQANSVKPGFIITLTHAIPSDEPTALPTPPQAQTSTSNTRISGRCITASAFSFARVPGFILGFVFGFVLGFVLVLRIVHLHGFTSFNAAAAAGCLSVSRAERRMANWVVCSPLYNPTLPAEHDFCNAGHRFPYIAGRAPRDSKSQQFQQSIRGE